MAMMLERRYDPFHDFPRSFPEMVRPFFGDAVLPDFKTDIRDMGEAYQLEADLPGLKKEDIHLQLNDGVLTIRAERHSQYEEEDKKTGYMRCERSYGSYSRSFDVSTVDTAGIKAAYADGVLTVTLPKQAVPKPDVQTIEIE